jgi:hypothetical protein
MKLFGCLFLFAAILSACAPSDSGNTQSGQPAVSDAFIQGGIHCSDIRELVGRRVTCWLEQAYCTYSPASEGTPTFCNDAPYPNHSFTMVAWETDWSYLDGECLLITGTVSLYEGIPEIEVRSSSQVEICN